MKSTIAIQGQAASFHDIVAKAYYPDQTGRAYCETFQDVFAAIENGSADYGVCAIENSLAGSIYEIYDLLLNKDVYVIGESYIQITMCLIGLAGAKIEDITKVYSHPVALAQCHEYLDRQLPTAQRLEFHDTAGSVAYVKEAANIHYAAIASRQAAELHGLNIIDSPIESNHGSATRFLVIGPDSIVANNANKTSLVLRTSHQPSALYHALGAFAKRDINLSKLQSRPITNDAWRYMFYVDVEAGTNDPNLTAALTELADQDCSYTILGSYQASEEKYPSQTSRQLSTSAL